MSNQSYDFDLSVGIKELLDADSAAKVESQVKQQKQRMEEPIEIKMELDIGDAKKQIKDLQKEMTVAANNIKKIQNKKKELSKSDYTDAARYYSILDDNQRKIDQVISQLKSQGVAVRATTREYKKLQSVLEEIGYVEKKKKTSNPRKKATSEVKQQTEAEREHVAAVEAAAEETKQIEKATKKATAEIERQTDAREKQIRTIEQVTSELEEERKKLKEIEDQQEKNDADREKFERKRQNYGGEVLGTSKAVYDIDKINLAEHALKNFNTQLEKRNQFIERYGELVKIISQSFVGQYGVDNGLARNIDEFIEGNSQMKQLQSLATNGIKGFPTKDINELFSGVTRSLKSSLQATRDLMTSGDVVGVDVIKKLDEEEIRLGQDQQRLYDAREAQLTKINELQREELDLIAKKGREEAKAAEQSQVARIKSKQLKLDKVKSDSGDVIPQTYTAVNGKYTIEKGTDGWNVYKTVEGYNELIATYETLRKLRADPSLIAESDALRANTEEVEKNTEAKKKASKIAVREFSSLAEYDAMQEKYQANNGGSIEYLKETVDIIRNASRFGTQFQTDLTTSCKKAKTAVERLFSAFDPDKYPALSGWKESILESIGNGYFSDREMYNGMFTGGYSWGVEALGEDRFYVYLNLLDVAKDKEEEYSAYLTQEYKKRDDAIQKESELIDELHQRYEELSELRSSKPSYDELSDSESYRRIIGYYEKERILLQDILRLGQEVSKIPAQYRSKTPSVAINEYYRTEKVTNGSLDDNEHHIAYFNKLLEEAQLDKRITPGGHQITMFEGMSDPIDKAVDSVEELKDVMQDVIKIPGQISFDDLIKSAKTAGDLIASHPVIEPNATRDAIEENIGKRPVEVPIKPISQPIVLPGLTTAEHNAAFGNGAVDELLKSYNVSVDAANIIADKFKQVAQLYKAMVYDVDNNGGRNVEQINTQFNDYIQDIVGSIIKVGSTVQSTDTSLEKFMSFMKGSKIRYDDTDRAEFGDNWKFTRQRFGKFLTKSPSAMTADSVYMELLGQFPDLFSKNVINPSDQLKHILEMLGRAIDAKKNGFNILQPLADTDRERIEDDVYRITSNMYDQMVSKSNEVLEAEVQTTNAVEHTNESRREGLRLTEQMANGIAEAANDGDSVASIIERNEAKALEALRNAKDNKTNLVDLSGVYSTEDLKAQLQSMATKTLGDKIPLSVGSIHIQDNVAAVTMYNEALGVTYKQLYQIQEAADNAGEAQLKLWSESYGENYRAAKKYNKAQINSIARSDNWLLGQASKLDAQERKYKYSGKKIDGSTKLLGVDETSLTTEADKTIDSLAEHIRNTIQSSLGQELTEEIRSRIINDLRVLDNEIKIQQYKQYVSTTMKPNELQSAKEELEYTLQSIESKAKKNNVFSKISNDVDKLRTKLQGISDGPGLSEFVDSLRVVRSKLGAEMAKGQENAAAQRQQIANYKKLIDLQKKYNEADYKWHQADISGGDKSPYNAQMESYMKQIQEVRRELQLTAEQQLELDRINNEHNLKKTKLLDSSSIQETKDATKELDNLRRLQNQLYDAKMKLAKLEASGDTSSASWLKASRLVEEREKEYDAACDVVKGNERINAVLERQISLEEEINRFRRDSADKKSQQQSEEELNRYYAEQNERIKAQTQQGYKYNNGKTFEDQVELDRMSEYYKAEESRSEEYANNIRSTYNTMLGTIKQINALDTKIGDLTLKDNGRGLYSSAIESFQTQKSSLWADVRSLQAELTSALSFKPDSSFKDVLSEIQGQAILTTDEVQKFYDLLLQTDNIKFNFQARVNSQIQPIVEKITSLREMIANGDITDEATIRNINNMAAGLDNAKRAFEETKSPADTINYLKYSQDISGYISSIDQLAQKEKEYFAGMTQYTGQTMYDKIDNGTTSSIDTAKKKLEDFVEVFTKGKGVITSFTTAANGVSRVNFSVFNEITKQAETSFAEIGRFNTKGVFYNDTFMKDFAAGTNAATQSVNNLISTASKLSQIDGAQSAVSNLMQLAKQLQDALNAPDATSEAGQNKLKGMATEANRTCKETEKLVQEWAKLQNIIDGKNVKNIGNIDSTRNPKEIQNSMWDLIKTNTRDAIISFIGFDDVTKTLTYSLTDSDGIVTTMTAHMVGLNGAVITQQGETSKLATGWQEFTGALSGVGKSIMQYIGRSFTVWGIVSQLKKGFNEVKEIDSALTELRKVTDETEATYKNFLQTMSKSGEAIGSTVKDLTSSAADWARLGYSIEEAGKLAENTMVLMNVSEFSSVSDATDSMISALQAFKDEDSDIDTLSKKIIDVYNQIGNNYAISTSDLADSLTRSSASLVAANNTLEQSVALTTAANTITQNPETVGTTLKTLAMRIRGVKSELEEAGEGTEGMITNTSKLQAKVQALTNVDGSGGVNILTNSKEFKSTYDILLEISKVWDKMSDVDQAALLEIIAGKRAGSTVAGILQNGDILESSYKDALDANGSAQKELGIHMDSIHGKLEQLSNSAQTMWMNFMNSDVSKFFIDVANVVVKLTDKIGLLNVAFATFMAKTAFKSESFGVLNWVNKKKLQNASTPSTVTTDAAAQDADTVATERNTAATNANTQASQMNAQASNASAAADNAEAQASAVSATADNTEAAASNAAATADATEAASSTASATADSAEAASSSASATADVVEAQASTQAAVADATEAASSNAAAIADTAEATASGMAAAGNSAEGAAAGITIFGHALEAGSVAFKLFNAAATMGISLIAGLAVNAIIKGFDELTHKVEKTAEAAEKALSTYEDAQKKLNSQKSSIKELASSYEELSKGVDLGTNKNIKLSTSSYKKYLDVCNDIADMYPHLVTGFDAQGNAILSLKGNVDELTQSYKEAAQANRQEIIAGGDKIFDAFKDAYNGDYGFFSSTSGMKDQLKYAEKYLKLLNGKNVQNLAAALQADDIGGMGSPANKNPALALTDMLESVGIDKTEFHFLLKNPDDDGLWDTYAQKITSFIVATTSKINKATSGVKTLMDAYLGEDLQYATLDKNVQSAINDIVHNLDTKFVSGFDNADELWAWIKTNIIDVFAKPEIGQEISDNISKAFDLQSAFKNGNIDLGVYEDNMLRIVDDIKNSDLDKAVQDKILQMFDIDLDAEDSIGKDIDQMLNYANSIFKPSLSEEDKKSIEKEMDEIVDNDFDQGKVDLKLRPSVDTSELSKAGWGNVGEGYATVFSQTYSNESGTMALNFTPIMVDEDGKYIGTLSPDELQKYAEEVMSTGVDSKKLQIGKTYIGTNALELAEEDAQRIHELQEMYYDESHSLDELSYSDLQIINSDQFKVPEGTLLTWNELQAKIKEVRIAMTQDFTTSNYADYAENISAISSSITTYQEALEKLESGNFTITDFMELISEYPELAKGVDVASKKFNGLSKNLRKAIRSSPDALVDDLKELKAQLIEAGKSTEDIDRLIDSIENMPEDAVASLVDEYITLTDQIEDATIAQNKLKEAMSENPNEGYETRGDAIEQMKDLMEKGQIGSESELWSIAEAFGFTYDSAKTIQENADALYEFITAREKWYAKDEDGEYTYDGTKSFASTVGGVVNSDTEIGEKLRSLGMVWDFDGKQLNFDFDNANWEEIISLLGQTDELAGLTSEEFYDLLMQMGQFFDINWQDGDDLIWFMNQLSTGAESVSENFDSTKKAVQSFLKSNEISTDWLDKDVSDLDQNGVIDVTETDEFKKLPEDIQNVLTKYYELKHAFEEDPLGINWQLDKNDGQELNQDSIESISQITSVMQDNENGTVFIDYTHLEEAAKEAGYTEEAIDAMIKKIKEYNNVCGVETSDTDPLGLVGIKDDAKKTEQYLTALQIKFETIQNEDHTVSYKVETESVIDALVAQGWTTEKIQAYLTTLEDSGSYTFTINGAEIQLSSDDAQKTIQSLIEEKKSLSNGETTQYTVTGTGEKTVDAIQSMWDNITKNKTTNYTINRHTNYSSSGVNSFRYEQDRVNGTAHVNGTAYKSGSWGASETTTALTGELGPELRVRGNEWTLVGENGAEFTDIRKGDVVFNHKQTESLLKNGYVTGRGKAYASGTGSYKKYTFSDTNASSKLSKAAKDISTASDKLSDDFKEIFDWIEVRIEEITNDIDIATAKLDNAIGSKKQNAIIDDMIGLNKALYSNLIAGASEYYKYAKKLLEKVPAEYREAAKDGTIAIESFTGKVGESTLEAIQDYREWVQKGDDLTQQAEETLTEISSLAKQAVDNIASDYDNKKSIRDSKIDQYDAYNSLLETDVGFESEKIYQAMMSENKSNIGILQKQRDAMLAELNKRVESGEIKKYSQDWYDVVNDISAVDTEIIELKTDIEDYQDSINELHWDKFDLLMDKLNAVSDEADNLIDVLSSKDLVNKDTAEWTDEGITTLGLYAQKMDAAEVQAKKYEEQINYLNKNWKKLGYTEQEYIDKLDELKSGQYDAIKAYNDTKDAIVDLNKERVEAIKTIIQDEIDAYTELINKKKEELDSEKDLYDFQKSVSEKQKDIAKIQRQLAALAGDNSASAKAKRAQLEAELLDAQADLEETYYDRSVSNQQEALDKELESFEDAKNDEMEGWDEYLENTNKVVADSLDVVKANTNAIYQELQTMGQEYGLSITESLISPWKEGENAIQAFSEKFGLAMSATVDELKKLELEFMETMEKIEKSGSTSVDTVKNNASGYQSAEYKPPKQEGSSGGGSSSGSSSGNSGGGDSGGKSYPYGKASETSGNIKEGARGNQVKAIQYALNQLGYGNSGTKSVDGKFGSGTKSAVRAFQKAMGISADGIVGKNTRAKFRAKGYKFGTTGVDTDQFAWIDEMGLEEIVLHAQDGKLAYLTKGSAVLPHSISENLMKLGQLDPQYMLDINRPQASVSPSIINNTMELSVDNSIGTLISIENFDGNNPDEITKVVNKALEQHTKNLNNALRKFAR